MPCTTEEREKQQSASCPSFVFQDESPKRFRGEIRAKDLGSGLGNSCVFSTMYYFGPSGTFHLISASDLKKHLKKVRRKSYPCNRPWRPIGL
jgi:hypothetical protein